MIAIKELVEATKRRKRNADRSVGWPLAAILAIEGFGIRYKPDVDRLKKAVLAALRAEGVFLGRQRLQ